MDQTPRRPYTRLDPYAFSRTLAQRLAGSRLVDPLRDLVTRFGLRKYDVRVVRIRWSGGSRGSGEPYVERELLLEPTPKVLDIGALNESVEGVGVQEIGQVEVIRISTSYSEEDLRGLLRGEREHPLDVESFWEIRFLGDKHAQHRRFNLTRVPERETLGWKVALERAFEDRDSRTGNLSLSKPSDDDLENVP